MNEIQGVAQIALSVRDIAAATSFYRDSLGLWHLFDAPGLSFFDVGGVRLMLSAQGGEHGGRGTLIYFKVDDVATAHVAMVARKVPFEQVPHVVGRTPSSEVWLAFCTDPDGNLLGLMSERSLT